MRFSLLAAQAALVPLIVACGSGGEGAGSSNGAPNANPIGGRAPSAVSGNGAQQSGTGRGFPGADGVHATAPLDRPVPSDPSSSGLLLGEPGPLEKCSN